MGSTPLPCTVCGHYSVPFLYKIVGVAPGTESQKVVTNKLTHKAPFIYSSGYYTGPVNSPAAGEFTGPEKIDI